MADDDTGARGALELSSRQRWIVLGAAAIVALPTATGAPAAEALGVFVGSAAVFWAGAMALRLAASSVGRMRT